MVQVLAAAGATLDITFQSVTAAALILEDVIRHEFADEQPVRALMTAMLNEGQLAEDEVVVTYVKEARSGVVATTYDARRGADVDVSAALGSGAIQIARIGGHLKVTSQHGSQTVVTAGEGRPLTPVYRALALRRNRRWWSFWRSWLEVQSVIPARSFGPGTADPGGILGDRPSLAIPRGEAGDDQASSIRG